MIQHLFTQSLLTSSSQWTPYSSQIASCSYPTPKWSVPSSPAMRCWSRWDIALRTRRRLQLARCHSSTRVVHWLAEVWTAQCIKSNRIASGTSQSCPTRDPSCWSLWAVFPVSGSTCASVREIVHAQSPYRYRTDRQLSWMSYDANGEASPSRRLNPKCRLEIDRRKWQSR